MTREEHIENLKAIASDMPSDKCSDWIESLMAGVKALEQEPCEDCISRESALDDAGLGEFHRYDDYVKMRNYLKSLPSVTPRPKIENAPLSMIKYVREKEVK